VVSSVLVTESDGPAESSFVPHFPQKTVSAGFSNWHLGHFKAGISPFDKKEYQVSPGISRIVLLNVHFS
jgi:hypothetical protein